MRHASPASEYQRVSGIRRVTFNITTAQLQTLLTSPITIAPAPGPGKLIVPLGTVVASFTAGSQPYGTDGGLQTISLAFAGAGGPIISSLLDPTGGTAITVLSAASASNQTLNAALTVSGDGNEPLAGRIDASSLNAGGINYLTNDTFTVNGGGTLATGIVTLAAAGVVQTYTINTKGAGYTVSNNVATTATSGTGTGFTIDITTVAVPGNGTASVRLMYWVVDLS